MTEASAPTRLVPLPRRAVLGAAGALVAGRAAAYPDRPVQLLVGFSAGGNIDIAARLAAPFLERHLGGAAITVLNRPGANGTLMLAEAAASRPDGHVVAFLSLPGMVTSLQELPQRYGVDSFAYAGMLTDEPYTLFVGAGAPWRSLAELVAAARARPETIPLAGAGAGSAPHLALRALEAAAGVRFTWVPMAGAAQALTLVEGGHVAGAVSTVSLTVRQHQAGAVRILGLMDSERYAGLPEVPTVREAGWEVVAGSARGFGLPAATPEAVVRLWEAALRDTAADPAFRALAARDHLVVRHLDGAATRALVEAENRRYAALWRSSPWR